MFSQVFAFIILIPCFFFIWVFGLSGRAFCLGFAFDISFRHSGASCVGIVRKRAKVVCDFPDIIQIIIYIECL